MPRVLTSAAAAARTLSESAQVPKTGLFVPFTPPRTPGSQIYAQTITPRTLTEASA